VLLLDEPLSGLDPRARIEMRALLRRLGGLGKTIIVSSHILPELADVCNKVGIIDKGVLGVNASVAEVMKQVRARTVLHIAIKGDQEAAASALEESPLIDQAVLANGQIEVTLKEGIDDYSELASLLVARGYRLMLLREEEINLESAFMALTKGTGKNF
jgi:ABC-2 type transport system ATP-binding protein